MHPPADSNGDRLRRVLEGIPGGDLDVLDEVTSEDVVFEAVTGKQFESRPVVKQVLAESMAAYERMEVEVDWVVEDGDRVVASTRTTGRPREDILGVPPPEGERTIDGMFDALFEDGELVYMRQMLDTRQMMPAAMRHGRGAVLEGLGDAVLVLDDRNLVVDANRAAGVLLGAEREAVLGESVDDLLDLDPAPLWEGERVEVERDGAIYELRGSPVLDPDGEQVGRTVVARDVTARTRRIEQLRTQRDELERLSDLNAVIRGVNRVLVSASDREEIERLVCEHLADSGLYRAARVADVTTWLGDAERWTVAGDDPADLPSPPVLEEGFRDGDDDIRSPVERATADGGGVWTAVPLVYGRTVFGALGLYTERPTVAEREHDVLVELGETIGHAINAVETRRLLSAEAVVELELASTDGADPLVAVTGTDDGTELSLSGLVPSGEHGTLAYLSVSGASTEAVATALAERVGTAVRVVSEDDGEAEGVLEWSVTGDAPLGTLVEFGAHVEGVRAADGRVQYTVQVASDADVRSLVEHVSRRFTDTAVVSKEERSGPVETPASIPAGAVAELTDRQREALEVAYRAGYFEWPRDSTAEEVAEGLDIAPATLHSHLRKAQGALLGDLFDESGSAD